MSRRALFCALFLPLSILISLGLADAPVQRHTKNLSTKTPHSLSNKHRFTPLLKKWLKACRHLKTNLLEKRTLPRSLAPFLLTRTYKGKEEVRLGIEYTGKISQLRSTGFAITSHFDRFYTGWMPSQKLASLGKLKALRYASFSQKLRSHLNVSTPLIHVPQARLEHQVDGRGVIIGIIDTGIDYRHPAFLHQDGTTRLLAIVDYSLPSKDKAKKRPRIFLRKEINQALKAKTTLGHEDLVGHGTHIAGIALGNGNELSKKNSRYLGVAPRADLIMVKAIRAGSSEFDSADVLDGIIYIHQLAKGLKKPYVLNLSLGGHRGGHNGSSFLERAIDVFSGKNKPGRTVVVSAGNEGNKKIHASGWLRPPHIAKIQIDIPQSQGSRVESKSILLELWFPEAGKLTLFVQSPSGKRFGPFGISKETDPPIHSEDGTLSISYALNTFKKAYHHLSIVLSNNLDTTPKRPLKSGKWIFELSGESPRYDLWFVDATSSLGKIELSGHTTQEMLIGVPGSAAGAITVGSFNSRSGWSNQLGGIVEFPLQPGERSDFSSPGPTLDERPKPEIVAPGIYIAAAASAFSNFSESSLMYDGPYLISQGTSQAAPHVAGTIALLLQKQPRLDTPMIRQLLIQNTSTDTFTKEGAVYHHEWGFGKLNAFRALNALKSKSSKAVSARQSTLGSLRLEIPADGLSHTFLYIIPKDQQGQGLGKNHKVELQTTAGRISDLRELNAGFFQAKLVSSQQTGHAMIKAWIDGILLQTELKITFVAPNHNIPKQGCSCQGDDSFNPSYLLELFFAMLFPLLYLSKKA